MISCKNITKIYKNGAETAVLKNVSFEIKDSEFVAIWEWQINFWCNRSWKKCND
jgi:energy-coupling factor transporter ATP-binding protein EcfA2